MQILEARVVVGDKLVNDGVKTRRYVPDPTDVQTGDVGTRGTLHQVLFPKVKRHVVVANHAHFFHVSDPERLPLEVGQVLNGELFGVPKVDKPVQVGQPDISYLHLCLAGPRCLPGYILESDVGIRADSASNSYLGLKELRRIYQVETAHIRSLNVITPVAVAGITTFPVTLEQLALSTSAWFSNVRDRSHAAARTEEKKQVATTADAAKIVYNRRIRAWCPIALRYSERPAASSRRALAQGFPVGGRLLLVPVSRRPPAYNRRDTVVAGV
ncbi:hypothetical protein PspLS_01762 [Pyricularia sp. CBS 133598]|nr:hypothetical protein PspLS_01762 [Pyricularia sp. CBS 133598]